jgi:hypothetical protein
MAHYELIFDAIAAHVKTAWSVVATSGGRAPKPNVTLPLAVITLESCDRNQAGRSVEQTWTWTIGGKFAIPAPPDPVPIPYTNTDPQLFMAEQAEALIDLLTPFSENSGSLPTVPSAFGGVGYQPFVSTWSPIPMDDADDACGVLVTFIVRTTVWQ